MHLLFCDIIYVVIPGQRFIYDHTKIFRVILLCECIVCIWGYGIWLCGVHYISGDGNPFVMFLPTWPICLDLVEGLSRQYH